MCTAELGAQIDLEVKSGTELTFFGIGGIQQTAYFHHIGMEVGGYEFPCYAGFSYDLKSLPYGILGQVGFFNFFRVQFNYEKQRIELWRAE